MFTSRFQVKNRINILQFHELIWQASCQTQRTRGWQVIAAKNKRLFTMKMA